MKRIIISTGGTGGHVQVWSIVPSLSYQSKIRHGFHRHKYKSGNLLSNFNKKALGQSVDDIIVTEAMWLAHGDHVTALDYAENSVVWSLYKTIYCVLLP